MTIDNDMMLQLERRAALELTEAERAETLAQINAVLASLDALRACPDTSPEGPAAACPLRADEVLPSTDRAALLANAPDGDGEFFLVPRTVE